MIEWTVPDGHKLQKEIAEVFGWSFYDEETQDRCREWLCERFPKISAVGFYEDVLEETNAILMFETEEQFTWWMMKHG